MCFAYFGQICQYPGWGKNLIPENFAAKLFVMTACDILRWTVKFECTKNILSQDIVWYMFCLIWSINSRVGWKCHPEHFALKLFVMIACANLRKSVKFECTKTNICQDTARYVVCLFWSDLSIPGVGQNFHPEYFAAKVFAMTACDILRWTVKFECTTIILSQDIVRYVFCLIWSFLLTAGVGWKCHPRTLCPKTICNDCLCYSEIICDVWMYKNQFLPRYS